MHARSRKRLRTLTHLTLLRSHLSRRRAGYASTTDGDSDNPHSFKASIRSYGSLFEEFDRGLFLREVATDADGKRLFRNVLGTDGKPIPRPRKRRRASRAKVKAASAPGVPGTKLRPKRRRYKPHEKEQCVNIVREHGKDFSAALCKINKVSGYNNVCESMLRRWLTRSDEGEAGDRFKPAKPGRKVNAEFEQVVLERLTYRRLARLATQDSPAKFIEKATAMYSWAIVAFAAKEVQKLPEYASDPLVMRLHFSHKWIRGFFRRNGRHRRRTTATQPPVVDAAAVQARRADMQVRNARRTF